MCGRLIDTYQYMQDMSCDVIGLKPFYIRAACILARRLEMFMFRFACTFKNETNIKVYL